MDFLKKIGDACRLHYEKILLSLVLIGLATAVLYLNKTKEDEETKIQNCQKEAAIRHRPYQERILHLKGNRRPARGADGTGPGIADRWGKERFNQQRQAFHAGRGLRGRLKIYH